MSAKPFAVALGCLGCCVFPCIVMTMVLTYEQQGGWGEPGPFPYSAVHYIFYADVSYTAGLIYFSKGSRTLVAWLSIPLLAVTAVMVSIAGAWFRGYYL
jgi:hypothetical protein